MSTTSELTELDQQIRLLVQRRRELEDKLVLEEAPKLRALVGLTFRYRNCYSCPAPDEYWYMYTRVVAVKNGNLRIVSIQKDHLGEISVDDKLINKNSLNNYEQINFASYLAAVAPLLREIAANCAVNED